MLFIGAYSHKRLDWPAEIVSHELVQNCQCSVTVVRSTHQDSSLEKRYLICIDGLDDETHSLAFKNRGIWSSKSRFLILHVNEPPIGRGSENAKRDAQLVMNALNTKHNQMSELTHKLSKRLLDEFPGCVVHEEVVEEVSPVETILEVARLWNADVIVLCPRKHSHAEKFWQGSVTEEVARRATCSVEIVR